MLHITRCTVITLYLKFKNIAGERPTREQTVSAVCARGCCVCGFASYPTHTRHPTPHSTRRSCTLTMKRSRDPLGRMGSPNAFSSSAADSDATHKRGRQRQQEQLTRPIEELCPFRALLALCGVVWMEQNGRDRLLGFPCRCNPSKLRVGVEKALVHDSNRRREFVEVRAQNRQSWELGGTNQLRDLRGLGTMANPLLRALAQGEERGRVVIWRIVCRECRLNLHYMIVRAVC